VQAKQALSWLRGSGCLEKKSCQQEEGYHDSCKKRSACAGKEGTFFTGGRRWRIGRGGAISRGRGKIVRHGKKGTCPREEVIENSPVEKATRPKTGGRPPKAIQGWRNYALIAVPHEKR